MADTSTDSMTSLKRFQKPRSLAALLAGVLILLLLSSFLVANAAAHGYRTDSANYTASVKQSAKTAQGLNYDYFTSNHKANPDAHNGFATAADVTAAKAACDPIHTLSIQLARQASQPKLASNIFTTLGSLFSANYRSADDISLQSLASQVASLQKPIQRTAQYCKAIVGEYSAQAIDATNIDARANLLASTCANSCLQPEQIAAYKQLYGTEIAQAKTEVKLYDGHCTYPELTAACKALDMYWQHQLQHNNDYYNALVPGQSTAAADAVSFVDPADGTAFCAGLTQLPATIYAQAQQQYGKDCTDIASAFGIFDRADHVLIIADKATILTTASKILAGS